MNLINGTHHLCERKEYAFMVLREYTIIPLHYIPINFCHYIHVDNNLNKVNKKNNNVHFLNLKNQ